MSSVWKNLKQLLLFQCVRHWDLFGRRTFNAILFSVKKINPSTRIKHRYIRYISSWSRIYDWPGVTSLSLWTSALLTNPLGYTQRLFITFLLHGGFIRVNCDVWFWHACTVPTATVSGKVFIRANKWETDAVLVCADSPDVSFCLSSMLLSK